MKKFYLGALALSMAFAGTAQYKAEAGVKEMLTPHNRQNVKVLNKTQWENLKKRDTYFSEDFSAGFDGGWSTEALPSSTGIEPVWEWRGPETTPYNVSYPTDGPCSYMGTDVNDLILETQANGYMVMDGNRYDMGIEGEIACAGSSVGQGEAPGPHTSYLISPVMDLSAATNGAAVNFLVDARDFDAELVVEVTVDGGTTWERAGDVFALFGGTVEAAVSVDISQWATAQSAVQVRLLWSGSSYHAIVDDFTIQDPINYDYGIEEVFSDDITEWYEYLHLPLSQSHLLQPGMVVFSRGALAFDATLSVTITEPDGTVQGPFELEVPNMDGTVAADLGTNTIDTYTPTQVGTHTMEFRISSEFDGEDFDPSDNVVTRELIISESLWSDAFAANATVAFFPPRVGGAPGISEMMQMFHTFGEVEVKGIDYIIANRAALISQGIEVFEGDEFTLSLYEIDQDFLQSEIEAGNTPLAKSDLVTLLDEIVFELPAEEVFTDEYVIQRKLWNDTYTLGANKTFGISIFNSGEGYHPPVTTGVSNNSDLSSLSRGAGWTITTDDAFWTYNNVNTWLRAGVDSYDGVSDNTKEELTVNAHPNPANDKVTVVFELNNTTDAQVIVKDLAGKQVIAETVNGKAGYNNVELNVANLNSGVYFYSVVVNGNATTKKLVITH